MITCPNCGKENADESVHCGFCGHQLQEGGKKTMFGMAALDSDAIKAAAQAAKDAASQAAQQTDEASAFAKTEMMPSIQNGEEPAAPKAPEKDPFADDFAALEAQYGNDSSFDPPAPAAAPSASLPGLDTPAGAPIGSPAPQQPASSGPAMGGPAAQGAAGGPMVQSSNSGAVQKKSNKGLIIAVVAFIALAMLGCAITVAVLAFM
mgnify:CR=1 FL=1